jgi:ABC-type sugar transport system permease subunit
MSNGKAGNNGVVAGGGLGGAISILIPWVAKQFFDTDVPPNVAAAMATILIFIGGWIGKRV